MKELLLVVAFITGSVGVRAGLDGNWAICLLAVAINVVGLVTYVARP